MFIVFEGLDGAGCTTRAKNLTTNLLNSNIEAIYTKEPTNSPIGIFIRKLLSEDTSQSRDRTFALLFAADRQQHEAEIIKLLDKNKIVICDRYLWSSIAYQSGPNISIDDIEYLNAGIRKPDLTIYLNISVEDAWQNICARPNYNKEVYETKVSLEKVRKIYQNLTQTESNVLVVNSTSNNVDVQIFEQIKNIIKETNEQ